MENPGLKITGTPRKEQGARSIVVVGLGRGGTSAIAASLKALGIRLGDSYHTPNYEDLALATAYRVGDWKRLRAIIADYEREHAVFAWKLPNIQRHLTRIDRYLANPRYIIIYRDVFAIANRCEQVLGTGYLRAMFDALVGYFRILMFIRKHDPLALHVSYEKLLANPQTYAQTLADFCGLDATPENLRRVAETIQPAPPNYLIWCGEHQRHVVLKACGVDGVIDRANTDMVAGWALRIGQADAVEVEIVINGSPAGRVRADLYRKDLVTAGVSASGRAGFRFSFEPQQLRPGDSITVRIPGVQEELVNSPMVLA